MSYYTLNFKDLYENHTGTWEERVKAVGEELFNFNFPWYTDKADGSLENFKLMFVESHFTDEIGFETLGLFKMQLQRLLFQKMPFYTQLYQSLKITYDPLINHEIKGVRTGDKNGSGTTLLNIENGGADSSLTNVSGSGKINLTDKGSTENSGNGKTETANTSATDTTNDTQSLTSDYPQATFQKTKDYASGLTRGQDTGKSETTVTDKSSSETSAKITSENSSATTSEDSTETNYSINFGHTVKNNGSSEKSENYKDEYTDSGWSGGSKTDELEKYRSAIRNINEMLLREFDGLFMQIFEPLENNYWCSPIRG